MEWLAVKINQNKPLLEYNSNIKQKQSPQPWNSSNVGKKINGDNDNTILKIPQLPCVVSIPTGVNTWKLITAFVHKTTRNAYAYYAG